MDTNHPIVDMEVIEPILVPLGVVEYGDFGDFVHKLVLILMIDQFNSHLDPVSHLLLLLFLLRDVPCEGLGDLVGTFDGLLCFLGQQLDMVLLVGLLIDD